MPKQKNTTNYNFSTWLGKSQDFEVYFKPIKTSKFKIFSNHGGWFKYIFKPIKTSKFKIFSNHGGWFKYILSQLRQVNSKFSPTMVDDSSMFLKPIKTSKFKTFSNHGGRFKYILTHVRQVDKCVCIIIRFHPWDNNFLI